MNPTTPPASPPVPLDAGRLRLAISPIGWTNDDRPSLGGETPLASCLADMVAAGYVGCELGGKFPREEAALRATLAPYDLAVASAWISLYFVEAGREEETVTAFTAHLALLRAMGAKVVVVCECGHGVQGLPVPVDAARPRFDEGDWQRLLAGLHRVGAMARDAGLTIAYHPHMGTGVQTVEEIARLMEATDPALVSLLVDSGHAAFSARFQPGGSDLHDGSRLLRRFAPRVRHVHLKDVRRDVLERVHRDGMSFLDAVEAGVFTVPGDGAVDQIEMLRAVGDAGYAGWLVVEAEQDPAKAPPLEYARKAREFVREATGL
jgi:inosose dehydratase